MRCKITKGMFKYQKKPRGVTMATIRKAMNVESEHSTCKDVQRKIAYAHLNENKDYYKRLKKAKL